MKSPKNPFKASVIYSKPLKEIGSESEATASTVDRLKEMISFYTDQATKNKASSLVVIYENKKQYPSFEWVEVERFAVLKKLKSP